MRGAITPRLQSGRDRVSRLFKTLFNFNRSLGFEERRRQVVQGVKSRQHAPECEGCGDGDTHDRADPGDRAQVVSAAPKSGSPLKFSSSRTHVRQRISRSTISDGLNGASLRVADTRCRAMSAC